MDQQAGESYATFDTPNENLGDLLQRVASGADQLPDFQRDWIWDVEHVTGLLASVSLSYPIGAVMMLQAGNPDVRLKPRPIEGVQIGAGVLPERLILDGQQRITSLFQSLRSGRPVATQDAKGHPIKRWFYIDIDKALGSPGDREEGILAVPEDRTIRNFRGQITHDYTDVEKQCALGVFPVELALDTPRLMDWQMHYLLGEGGSSISPERARTWKNFYMQVIQRFQRYQLPVIVLFKSTEKVAVCQVFEKVNTGGVPLTVFELLTATFAADDFNLRDDWKARKAEVHEYRLIRNIESTDFLQAVTLLATYAARRATLKQGTPADRAPGISCKRREVLRVTLADYQQWADLALQGFIKAARLIQTQKIFTSRDLPYRTQLVPLASALALLGPKAESAAVREKFLKWYWCGVFGELYGGAIETRFARDVPELIAWAEGGEEPTTVQDASFASSRLLSLRSRNSAAYKGIYALLMRDGSRDFRSGEPIELPTYYDDKIDIHHIFPQRWCRSHKIPPARADSVVNKTALSARTNRIIGGRAPSEYLQRIENAAKMKSSMMDTILATHVIDQNALRADDFDRFLESRRAALLERVEAAMGKTAVRDTDIVQTVEYEEDDDEVDEGAA
ncbi:MAG: GmrSD restriction endonuclease domain-containing protein [Acidobacteriota bacterium]